MMTNTSNKNIKVFISYRNIEPSRNAARILDDRLSADGFETFFDTDEIRGGDIWAEKIYTNISESDVLVVLLQPETIESVWVQREVDYARGAKVRILPVQLGHERINVTEVLDKLAIDDTQFLRFDPREGDTRKIASALVELSKRTRDEQKSWTKELEVRRRPRQAPNNPSYRVYQAKGDAHPCEIHLATGDMSTMKNMDVLVNSMNDYMQMAQFYETKTLSSSLRLAGAFKQRGGRILDSVQQELNEQIADIGLPIEMREVIITHAGHPKSVLVSRNKSRYIFHVATSQVNIKTFKEKLTPITDDDGISEVVLNCLDYVKWVDERKGVISFEGSERYDEELAVTDNYEPIRSIIFPIFGTGRGGRSILRVTPPMIEAIQNFLTSHANDNELYLERIHICVYPETDVPHVRDIMDHYLEIKT